MGRALAFPCRLVHSYGELIRIAADNISANQYRMLDKKAYILTKCDFALLKKAGTTHCKHFKSILDTTRTSMLKTKCTSIQGEGALNLQKIQAG
jgi:hypothetical protein